MGQRTTFPWLFKAKDGQRLKAPVGVNSTGVRFNHLPRQIQPETAVVAGPFHHLMSQVTQAQLTVHAPEGVIVQPVGLPCSPSQSVITISPVRAYRFH